MFVKDPIWITRWSRSPKIALKLGLAYMIPINSKDESHHRFGSLGQTFEKKMEEF
jgi:hypothetical protein